MSGILSLCTGYGGLDLAVEAVTGARTVAVADACKFDKKGNATHAEPHRSPCTILAHRFPDVPNLGDLKAIDWSKWVGTEVVTAGYPCQPFSHAGKREGTDDPRHIFPFIAEGIRVVGPRLVVLENVRGHLALGFDTVLGTLADIGYDARWVCVRASDVGAPHRRERMFIVATPADSDGAGLQERGNGGSVRQAQRGQGSTADGGGGTSTADADRLGHERAGSARGRREGSADLGGTAPNPRSERYGRGQDGRGLGRLDGAHEGGSRERQWSREVAGDRGTEAAADTARHPWWVRERDARPATDWGQYAPAINRWATALGRPAPAPTERDWDTWQRARAARFANRKPIGFRGSVRRFTVPPQRRLSPRFVEFMMGLPEGWVTDVPDLTRNEQLKALGNGVVPQQAAAALTFLLNAQERAA